MRKVPAQPGGVTPIVNNTRSITRPANEYCPGVDRGRQMVEGEIWIEGAGPRTGVDNSSGHLC